ncbi:hypothetical protein [Fluviicola taffensis]|uniref:tyrosine-type recombinase/integrase n=1 Tax=Fluviicola taffensis TaxID=191579 RepID=UPI003137C73F
MKLKINFILKTGVEGEIPVLAIMNFGYKEFDALKQTFVYKPLRYYTGVKVNKSEWDLEQKLPKDKTKRAMLGQLEKQATDIFNYLITTETVTPERLKQELDVKIKKKDDRATVTRVRIVEFINDYVLNDSSIKKKTKDNYSTLRNRLLEFETKIGKPLYSNEIDEELYNSFIDTIRVRSNRINTVWSVYKDFRAVLKRIARKFKIVVFNPTTELHPTDKVRLVTEDKIYFDLEQIQRIIQYEPPTEELSNAKLILLTLLFTGCRRSDVHKIVPSNKYSKNELSFNYARYFSTKTDTEVVVPILKPLQDAIDANEGKVAYKMSESTFNELAKVIAEQCGFTNEITLSFTNSEGKKQFETKRVCDYVSSHVGRRSFITNLINFVPITVLSKITGHTNSISAPEFNVSDSSTIFKYNKISMIDNAARFMKELKRQVMENRDYFPFDLV